MTSLFLLLPTIFLSPLANAEVPSWAKDASHRQGNLYYTVCSGTGISVGAARESCLHDAVTSASEQLASEVKVQRGSYEDLNEVTLYKSVESDAIYRNLSCKQQKEQIFEQDGGYQVWLKCKFDLSKIVVVPTEAKTDRSSVADLAEPRAKEFQEKKTEEKTSKHFFSISTAPACMEILVRGEKNRTFPCKKNPTEIVLFSGDEEIVIRASKRKPKRIPASKLINSGEELVHVQLQ